MRGGSSLFVILVCLSLGSYAVIQCSDCDEGCSTSVISGGEYCTCQYPKTISSVDNTTCSCELPGFSGGLGPCVSQDECSIMTQCGFEVDTCNIVEVNEDPWQEDAWSRTQSVGSPTTVLPDHTSGGGMFYATSGTGISRQSTIVLPPIEIQPGSCFSMWYNTKLADMTITARNVATGAISTLLTLAADSQDQESWQQLLSAPETASSHHVALFVDVTVEDAEAYAALDDINLCSACPTNTPTVTISPTTSSSVTVSSSLSLTATTSVSLTSSVTVSSSLSLTGTTSVSLTGTLSPTTSSSASTSSSLTPSSSMTTSWTSSSTTTGSASFTQSSTGTFSPTFSTSITTSSTASETATMSPSASGTAAVSPSRSVTATDTADPSSTQTYTPTVTHSSTISPSLTPSVTPTTSPSTSITSSVSPTISVSASHSKTISVSRTVSPSPSAACENPQLRFPNCSECINGLYVPPVCTHCTAAHRDAARGCQYCESGYAESVTGSCIPVCANELGCYNIHRNDECTEPGLCGTCLDGYAAPIGSSVTVTCTECLSVNFDGVNPNLNTITVNPYTALLNIRAVLNIFPQCPIADLEAIDFSFVWRDDATGDIVSDSALLDIAAGDLKPSEEYTFTLTVMYEGSHHEPLRLSSTLTVATRQLQELEAYIEGGSIRSHNSNNDLNVAITLPNPPMDLSNLQYSWVCQDLSVPGTIFDCSAPFTSLPATRTLNFDANELASGYIRLISTVQERRPTGFTRLRTTAQVVIEYGPTFGASAYLPVALSTHQVQNPLFLRVEVDEPELLKKIVWTEEYGGLDLATILGTSGTLTSSVLAIPPDVLLTGQEYLFRASLMDNSGKESYVGIGIEGTEALLSTSLILSVVDGDPIYSYTPIEAGCSASGSSSPYFYEFSYRFGDEEVLVQSKLLQDSTTMSLPPGEVTIMCKAYSAAGSKAVASQTRTVRSSTATSAEVDANIMSDFTGRVGGGDAVGALAVLRAAQLNNLRPVIPVNTLVQAWNSLPADPKLYGDVMYQMNRVMDSCGGFSDGTSTLDASLSLFETVTGSMGTNMDRFFTETLDSPSTADVSELVANLLESVNTIQSCTPEDATDTHPEQRVLAMKALARATLKTVEYAVQALGQYATCMDQGAKSMTDPFGVTIRVQTLKRWSEDTEEETVFTPPSTLLATPEASELCTGDTVSYVAHATIPASYYRWLSAGEVLSSDVQEVSIYSNSPSGGRMQKEAAPSIPGTATELYQILLPHHIPQAIYNVSSIQCVYWNETSSTWMTDGTALAPLSEDEQERLGGSYASSVCQSSHLTAFALQCTAASEGACLVSKSSGGISESMKWLLVAVGAVIVVIVGIVVLRVHHRHLRRKDLVRSAVLGRASNIHASFQDVAIQASPYYTTTTRMPQPSQDTRTAARPTSNDSTIQLPTLQSPVVRGSDGLRSLNPLFGVHHEYKSSPFSPRQEKHREPTSLYSPRITSPRGLEKIFTPSSSAVVGSTVATEKKPSNSSFYY